MAIACLPPISVRNSITRRELWLVILYISSRPAICWAVSILGGRNVDMLLEPWDQGDADSVAVADIAERPLKKQRLFHGCALEVSLCPLQHRTTREATPPSYSSTH